MRRGFTITEILVVIGIILLAASITYPIISGVKISSKRSACVSNLHQIGIALQLYRESGGGAERGSPVQMGFPPNPGPLSSSRKPGLSCQGNNPEGNSYHFNWPTPDDGDFIPVWTRYVDAFGQASIVLFDPNHQPSFPRSYLWENWSAVGLRLDGSVILKTRMGFPKDYGWWHQ